MALLFLVVVWSPASCACLAVDFPCHVCQDSMWNVKLPHPSLWLQACFSFPALFVQMFMHGTNVVKFARLLKVDIPHEWTEHSEQQAQVMATAQGRNVSDMETIICLVAPECPLSLCYKSWLTATDHSLALQTVPLCIVCASTFDHDFGHMATEKFHVSMRLHGRPHHFQILKFEK